VDPFLEILKEFSICPISTLKPKGRSVLNEHQLTNTSFIGNNAHIEAWTPRLFATGAHGWASEKDRDRLPILIL
jgi:hypothetical protein